jgi:hypothetical protein
MKCEAITRAIEVLERDLADMRARLQIATDLEIGRQIPHFEHDTKDQIKRATSLHVFWGGIRDRWGAPDFETWCMNVAHEDGARWLIRYSHCLEIEPKKRAVNQ